MVTATPDGNGQAAEFAAHGYLVLRGALSAEPCIALGQAATGEYARLAQAGWRFAESGSLAGHLNFAMGPGGQVLVEALVAAAIPELLAALAGEPLVLAQAVGNLNMPGSVHQDFHIDGAFERCSLIANVCLVPTDATNGATELVPGSNRAAMSYWRFHRDGWRGRGIRPELEPGDVVIRPTNLWHRGTPNRSSHPRPMAAFVWSPAALAVGSEAASELARPLTIFGNKYYGPLRRVKEFVAVRLPWLDEGARLGRSWLGDRG